MTDLYLAGGGIIAILGLACILFFAVRKDGATSQIASDAEQVEKSNAAMLKARTDVAADSASDSLRNHDF